MPVFCPVSCFFTDSLYITRIFKKKIGPSFLFLASGTTDTKFRHSTGVATANSTSKYQKYKSFELGDQLITMYITRHKIQYLLKLSFTTGTQSAHCHVQATNSAHSTHCTLHTLGCYTLLHCPVTAYSVHLDHHEATQTSSVKRGEPSSLDHHEVTPTGSVKCMLKHKNRPNTQTCAILLQAKCEQCTLYISLASQCVAIARCETVRG